MVPHMRVLWSDFCINAFVLFFSFSNFSDRQSLKIENENNNMHGTRVPRVWVI